MSELEQLKEENRRLKDTLISVCKIVKENKEKWEYFESRFVQVDFCSEEQRTKCLLYPLDCQGDNCKSFIDLVDLLDKAIDKGAVQ